MRMRTPEIRATVSSTKLQIIIPATIGGVTFAIFVAVWFQTQFAIMLSVVTIVAGAGGVIWVISLAGRKVRGGLIGVEEIKQARAITRRMELEATVVETRHGLIMPDRYIPPTVSERRGLLPDVIDGEATEAGPPPIDFFDAMLGTKQPYKILAEQRRGKSYLAMHITDRAGGHCVVIGTKFEIDEWPNAVRFLVDPERVAYGLRHFIEMVKYRHRYHKRMPIIRVFLDDWINTVIQHQQLALEFLDLASTQMVSAGIVPYFLLQGDGNDDWGSRRSAMLKNNFSGLWVTGPRDGRGDPIPQLNTAVIRYPGSREEIPVRLPTGLPQLGVSRLPEPRVVQPEPSEADALFVALVESGQSRDAASFEAYGKGYGGNSHVRRLKGLLGEQ